MYIMLHVHRFLSELRTLVESSQDTYNYDSYDYSYHFTYCVYGDIAFKQCECVLLEQCGLQEQNSLLKYQGAGSHRRFHMYLRDRVQLPVLFYLYVYVMLQAIKYFVRNNNAYMFLLYTDTYFTLFYTVMVYNLFWYCTMLVREHNTLPSGTDVLALLTGRWLLLTLSFFITSPFCV